MFKKNLHKVTHWRNNHSCSSFARINRQKNGVLSQQWLQHIMRTYLICSLNNALSQWNDFAAAFYFITQEIFCLRQRNYNGWCSSKTRNDRMADEPNKPPKPRCGKKKVRTLYELKQCVQKVTEEREKKLHSSVQLDLNRQHCCNSICSCSILINKINNLKKQHKMPVHLRNSNMMLWFSPVDTQNIC